MSSRRVVLFSCGAASAVAAKLTVAKGGDVAVINAFGTDLLDTPFILQTPINPQSAF